MTERRVSRTLDVDAPPAAVFDLLADPRAHGGFGMSMRLGVPYTMRNEVVEFEQDRRIAWRHVGHHRWRYELEPLEGGRTRVTETFDWSESRAPWALELIGYPATNTRAIEKTLPRLKAKVEGRS